jgi:hypothetical protein
MVKHITNGEIGNRDVVGVPKQEGRGNARIVGVVHAPSDEHDVVAPAAGAANGDVLYVVDVQLAGERIHSWLDEDRRIRLQVFNGRLQLSFGSDSDDYATGCRQRRRRLR